MFQKRGECSSCLAAPGPQDSSEDSEKECGRKPTRGGGVGAGNKNLSQTCIKSAPMVMEK